MTSGSLSETQLRKRNREAEGRFGNAQIRRRRRHPPLYAIQRCSSAEELTDRWKIRSPGFLLRSTPLWCRYPRNTSEQSRIYRGIADSILGIAFQDEVAH